MATSVTCDGPCRTALPKHRHADASHGARETCGACKLGAEGFTIGLLDPAVYCKSCKQTWDAHAAAESAERVRLIEAFEGWRVAARVKLKAAGFSVLPDDDTPDAEDDALAGDEDAEPHDRAHGKKPA